ncbi:MAG: NAD(P)/FAD-dependent oxidoreductase [Planctomycetota bacterium]
MPITASSTNHKKAIIIGAGPAGLTAAYELLSRTDIEVVVLETSDIVGGISCTVNHNGNRIDIGGHRFFSKSDRVMAWWLDMLPMEAVEGRSLVISYQGKRRDIAEPGRAADPEITDEVMLLRSRKSRIYYLRRFFDYPIRLSLQTVRNLGLWRMFKIGVSYTKARVFPIRPEGNLEQFFINRFGRELYGTFFESYTEKVWGVPCREISAEWGAQRIKGLSVVSAIVHALKAPFRRKTDVAQKSTETSLIDQFLYPKLGPGQMWEVCAKKVAGLGGEIRMKTLAEKVLVENGRVTGVVTRDRETGEKQTLEGDLVFSTMPVKTLLRGMDDVPDNVREVGDGLVYRDFMTVGLLVDDLEIHEETPEGKKLVTDNWIYIQEPDVEVGRLQIFNNWSPYLVADRSKVWIGLEYFCDEGDNLWTKPDAQMIEFGARELQKIGILDAGKVRDSVVLRVPKTYPAYFGTHDRFDEIRKFVDPIGGLFLVGRNGMHRYNNQDHSMLASMTAVDNIVAGIDDPDSIWNVNTEQEYHEEKQS